MKIMNVCVRNGLNESRERLKIERAAASEEEKRENCCDKRRSSRAKETRE